MSGIVLASGTTLAEDTDVSADETLTVIGVAGVSDESSGSLARIEADVIAGSDAQGLANILALAPSASVQTNSRGESLITLRGAGERQTAVFFDGAPLNIPWDNRLNLAGIPANIITGANIYSGPVPVRFGANTSGGVVDLFSVGTDTGQGLRLEAGSHGHFFGEGHISAATGVGHLILAGGYRTRNGTALSSDADLPFSQIDEHVRTNTDLAQSNIFLRLSRSLGAVDLAATAFHVSGERGVAPESDRDPATARVRYWRYPEMDYTMGILSMDYRDDAGGQLSTTVSGQWFAQTIDSFASQLYDEIEDRQVDDDITWSFRAIYRHDWGPVHLGWSVNALHTEHHQQDFDPGSGGAAPAETFQGRTVTFGIDGELEAATDILVTGGIGMDWTDAPETGGRVPLDAIWEPRLSAGVSWAVGGPWTLRVGAARQSRMPTLRELYGTAINRFLPNPDLAPERITLTEASAVWSGDWGEFEITPFFRATTGLIDQRVVEADGRFLRQRINLAASRTAGVEIIGLARLSPEWSASGHVTWQRSRSRVGDGGPFNIPLSERPALLGRLSLDYVHPSGVSISGEAAYRGRSFSPGAMGDLVHLPDALTAALRIAYDLEGLPWKIPAGEFYMRADNIFDAAVFPQAGLPDPGRELRGGLKLNF